MSTDRELRAEHRRQAARALRRRWRWVITRVNRLMGWVMASPWRIAGLVVFDAVLIAGPTLFVRWRNL